MSPFFSRRPVGTLRGLRGSARGFTLMELVVTLALIGLMALMAAPLAEMTVKRGRERELRQALSEIRKAIDRYKVASDQGQIAKAVGDSGYPPNLRVLVEGVVNQRSPTGEKLYFLRRLPRDPFASDDLRDNESTWGLRAYSSPADAPMPGVDVYDVHSRSRSPGINGIPYERW